MADLPHRWLPRAAATGRVAGQFARAVARHALRPSESEERARGDAIVADLDRLKGLAMKVGQILSYMDVGLPEETAGALARLQTGAQPMDFAEVEAIVAAALGRPVDELFEGFERVPVAAASIGQVHRARVGGVPVAVKVRYPHVRETLAGDLAQVRPLARLASLATAVDGTVLVDELRDRLLEECDYRVEQRAQADAARALAGDPLLRVPGTLPERCAETVLTTVWTPGASYAEVLAGPAEARNAAAVTLSRFPFTTLFRHGFLHADPHPGNFLFPGEGQVVALDWGSVRRFTPGEIEPFRAFVSAVLEDDRAAFREAVIACGLAPRVDKFDFGSAWDMFAWLYTPYRASQFRFDAAWWQEGRKWTGKDNPNQRHQAIPKHWIWLLRVQWGLGAVLTRLRAEGDFGGPLRAVLAAPLITG